MDTSVKAYQGLMKVSEVETVLDICIWLRYVQMAE